MATNLLDLPDEVLGMIKAGTESSQLKLVTKAEWETTKQTQIAQRGSFVALIKKGTVTVDNCRKAVQRFGKIETDMKASDVVKVFADMLQKQGENAGSVVARIAIEFYRNRGGHTWHRREETWKNWITKNGEVFVAALAVDPDWQTPTAKVILGTTYRANGRTMYAALHADALSDLPVSNPLAALNVIATNGASRSLCTEYKWAEFTWPFLLEDDQWDLWKPSPEQKDALIENIDGVDGIDGWQKDDCATAGAWILLRLLFTCVGDASYPSDFPIFTRAAFTDMANLKRI